MSRPTISSNLSNNSMRSNSTKISASVLIVSIFGLASLSAQATSLPEELTRIVPSHPQVQATAAQYNALLAEVDVARAPDNWRGGLEGGPAYTKTLSGKSTGNSNVANIAIKAAVPVYDAGRVGFDTERAQLKANAQVYRVLEAQRDIAAKVALAYVDVMKRSALVADADEHRVHLNTFAARMQRIVQVDPGRGSDYSQAVARVAQQAQTVALRKAELAEAQGNYIAIGSQALASGAAKQPHDFSKANMTRQQMMTAVQAQPLVKAAQLDRDAEIESVKLAAAWDQPNVALETRLSSGRDGNDSMRYLNNLNIGFNMAWNRFDGGAGKASSAASKERLAAANSSLAAVQREAQGTLERFVTYADGLAGRPESAIKAQLCADQVRVAYAKQFEVARRPLLDVLNAENDWFGQRTAAISAHYESIAARLRVAAAVGDLWPVNMDKLKATDGDFDALSKTLSCPAA